MNLDALPDLPALRQIAGALWSRNAAVMVGAGFSRNCVLASPIAPAPPLWDALARPMAERLYNGSKHAPGDPLRLAEEYRTFFGQAALDDLVREQIRDESWAPGDAHLRLLELPWSDVLTTNYDTLLERAALDLNDRVYEVVQREADLAHARAPRIVKLHGTIKATEQFVLTEDDYRTYPERHAAFVNFARQSFLENELCLLGFSGDDPNFLQWSGWVRDRLGTSARRIYLAGVLDLSPAKRRYLEARNIAPIDFHPLVEGLELHEQHAAATKAMIAYLKAARPPSLHEWRPANFEPGHYDYTAAGDPARAAVLFRKALPIWRGDRRDYPGWLVAPRTVRRRLISGTRGAPFASEKALSALTELERAEILRELAWRHRTAFVFVDKWLAALMAEHADPSTSQLDREGALSLATTVLASARAYRDWDGFGKWSAVLEEHAATFDDHRALLNYERALKARDRLELEAFERLIPAVAGPDPAWALRRAALWADLDKTVQVEREIDSAFGDLQRRRRMDRQSIWLNSRLAWAQWWRGAISRGHLTESRPELSDLVRPEAEPWELLADVRQPLEKKVKEHRKALAPHVPKFEPGSFSDRSKSIALGGDGTSVGHDLERLIEEAGAPIRLGIANILHEAVNESFELHDSFDLDDWLMIIAATRSRDDSKFETFLGRVSVAKISSSDRAELAERTRAAIGYWRERLKSETTSWSYADARLSGLIKVLARLAVAMPDADAQLVHQLALDIAGDIPSGAFASYQELGVLADYSAQAIDPANRAQALDGAVTFPTAVAKKAPAHFWPQASDWLDDMMPPRGYVPPKSSVAHLVALVDSAGEDRPEAVFRLAYLDRHRLLDKNEQTGFAEALWRYLDDQVPPAPTVSNMLLSALLYLPAPADKDPRSLLASRLFGPGASQSQPIMQSILQVARGKQAERLIPDPRTARHMFDEFVRWRTPVRSEIVAALNGNLDQQHAKRVATVLGRVLAPALAPRDRTKARLDQLFKFLEEVTTEGAVEGLVPFARGAERDLCLERLRRTISGTTYSPTYSAVLATVSWRKVWPKASVPAVLVERIVSAAERRRWRTLTAVLWGIRRLLQDDLLSPAQVIRVCEILEELFDEADYGLVNPSSLEASHVSVIRAECVGLALDLTAKGHRQTILGRWILAAKADPLPEVRFARPMDARWADQ